MSTFLAGLRSRRWLNVGVFTLGTLSLLVAVATPLYARSSSEHLLDQRTLQRLNFDTGLQVEVASGAAASRNIFTPTVPSSQETEVGKDGKPKALSDAAKQTMTDTALGLADTDAANSFWKPPDLLPREQRHLPLRSASTTRSTPTGATACASTSTWRAPARRRRTRR